MNNEFFIQRCLDLAQNRLGRVAPNPMVGAVLVHDGKIIGEGFHQEYGHPHAEVNAINDAEKKHKTIPENTTLYVNLEPCNHQGKTPPCTNLIIEKGIKKVIIGAKDPNDKVQGAGIEKLKEAGCDVICGILEKECQELNKTFYNFHEKKRPYIVLKWVQSINGFISSEKNNNDWISNEYSRKLTHKWRSETQGIMIGTNTALQDNPQLNARIGILNNDQIRNPVRITIDKDLRLQKSLHLFDQSIPTLIFTQKETSSIKNLEYIRIDFGNNVIEEILNELYKRNIQSLLVEGGSILLNSFINKQLWDDARVFISDKNIANGIKAPEINGKLFSKQIIFDDQLFIYHPQI